MHGWMKTNDTIRIQYASKAKGVSNGWKKWIGAIRGLERTDAIEKKEGYEQEFTSRLNDNPAWKKAYGTILKDYEKVYAEQATFSKRDLYFVEGIYAVEAVRQARNLEPFLIALEGDGYHDGAAWLT